MNEHLHPGFGIAKQNLEKQREIEELYSFDKIFCFEAFSHASNQVFVSLIVVSAIGMLWFFCLFYFDSTPPRPGSATANNNNVVTSKLLTALRGGSPFSSFFNLKAPSGFLFLLVVLHLITSWIAFSLYSLKLGALIKTPAEALRIGFLPIMVFMFCISMFGVLPIVYIVRENVAGGFLAHLFSLFLCSLLFTNPYMEPAELSPAKSGDPPQLVPPHPYVAVLQLVAMTCSFAIVAYFAYYFMRTEMRGVLKESYPSLVEILDKRLPPSIWPNTDKEEKRENAKEAMKKVMLNAKR